MAMEIIAGLIVLGGCGYKLQEQVALGFPPFVTGVVEVIGVVSLLLEAFPTDHRFLARYMNWRFRPTCAKGSWCILLVHVAALLSTFQAKHIFHQDVGPTVLMAYCLSVLVISVPLQLVGVLITHRTSHTTLLFYVTVTAIGLSYIMYAVGVFFNRLSELEVSAIMVLALWTTVLQCLVHLVFPGSFSRGEATIVSHGTFLLFIFNHLLLYKVSRRHPVRPYTITAHSEVTFFLQTAGASSLLVAFVMFIGPSLRKTAFFYGVLLGVIGAVSTPILILALDKHFLIWIYDFVTSKDTRLQLFAYWGGCCVVVTILIRWSAQSLPTDKPSNAKNTHSDDELAPSKTEKESESDEDSCHKKRSNSMQNSSNTKTTSKKHKSDINRTNWCNDDYSGAAWRPLSQGGLATKSVLVARKYFHVFAIFVFLPGLIMDREMLMVASTCSIVVFIILEVMRKVQVWPVGEILDHYYSAFVDGRDSGPIVLTHLYLLIGFTAPLWLYPHPLEDGVHPALLAGLLSLGVGDTAASVFGTKFGYFKWPGTKKTMEGTMASIIFQIFTLAALDYADVLVGMEWSSALIAICLTSFLEAMTSQIDNLVLPLFMYILLVDPLRANYR